MLKKHTELLSAHDEHKTATKKALDEMGSAFKRQQDEQLVVIRNDLE